MGDGVGWSEYAHFDLPKIFVKLTVDQHTLLAAAHGTSSIQEKGWRFCFCSLQEAQDWLSCD